jgi:hypothetical protein
MGRQRRRGDQIAEEIAVIFGLATLVATICKFRGRLAFRLVYVVCPALIESVAPSPD